MYISSIRSGLCLRGYACYMHATTRACFHCIGRLKLYVCTTVKKFAG